MSSGARRAAAAAREKAGTCCRVPVGGLYSVVLACVMREGQDAHEQRRAAGGGGSS